ncbi:Alpha/Beta hydrolase protein [Earliella scabrosa]|nr:Alpha/Beta hydrolase protein [Earliella scabrosa]
MLGNCLRAIVPLLAFASVGASVQRANELHVQATIEDGDLIYGAADLARARVKDVAPSDKYLINGSNIPEVDWDIGDSWGGLMPISDDPDDGRQLYFWYFPPGPQGSDDDLIFWTNGGPGCSSLEGLSQENGPFSWAWGQARPTQNEFSWTNLSHVVYLEHPVGTGFSVGKGNATDENDIAKDIVGFLQQFLKVFPDLKGKKLYLSGESYAGMYVPYLANYIYEHADALELDLQGIWIADPVIGWMAAQTQIPAVDFVHKYDPVFSLNRTFMAKLDVIAEECQYAGYLEKYVTYPPNGLLPLFGNTDPTTDPNDPCDVWSLIHDAALLVNPGFNYYRIFDGWPILWDILGYPTGDTFSPQSEIYFDRTDVKKAINAPDVPWSACTASATEVFPHGDASLPPAFTVLPNVIEKSARTVIVHGLADFALIAEGARIVLQNMTWNGLQGFQTPIEVDTLIVDGMGALGQTHTERGLTYVEVALSGHMVPQFSPRAAFQTMQYLMGFRDTP